MQKNVLGMSELIIAGLCVFLKKIMNIINQVLLSNSGIPGFECNILQDLKFVTTIKAKNINEINVYSLFCVIRQIRPCVCVYMLQTATHSSSTTCAGRH